MEIKASAKFIRIAPRKVRLVVDVIRGKSLIFAEQQLQFIRKAASVPLLKLIRSAKTNAKANHDLDPNTLYIKSIIANEGPTQRRYMPRAHGKADVIRKRMTHVHLVLAERAEAKKKQSKKELKKQSKPETNQAVVKKSKKEESVAKKAGTKKTTKHVKS